MYWLNTLLASEKLTNSGYLGNLPLNFSLGWLENLKFEIGLVCRCGRKIEANTWFFTFFFIYRSQGFLSSWVNLFSFGFGKIQRGSGGESDERDFLQMT